MECLNIYVKKSVDMYRDITMLLCAIHLQMTWSEKTRVEKNN